MPIQVGGGFTPAKPFKAFSSIRGVSIKQFPSNIDHAEIVEFLLEQGLSPDKKDNISIATTGRVIIRDLEKEECDLLINSIHGKKCFNQILFCNGFLPLTPSKDKTSQDSTVDGKKSVPLVTVSSENS